MLIQSTYKKIKDQLPDYVLKTVIKLVPVFLFLSLVELVSLSALIPVIKIIIDPGSITEIGWVNNIYIRGGFQNQFVFVLTVLGLLFLIFVFRNYVIYQMTKYQANVTYKVASRLVISKYKLYMHKPYLFHIENDNATLLRNIIQMPFYFISGVVIPYSAIVSELIIIGLLFVSILLYNASLFLSIIILVVPFILFYVNFYRTALKNMSERTNAEHMLLYKKTLQSLESIRELIVFNKRDVFKPLIEKSINNYGSMCGRFYLINYFSPKVIELFAILAIFTIMGSSFFIFNLSLDYIANYLIIFVVALYRIVPSINKILLSINNIRANDYTFQYFSQDDNNIPETEQIISVKAPLKFNHSIVINNLSFAYPNTPNPVLKNLNFTINKGENIGIIGVSGSGKTTFLNILLRLFKENEGMILVDDVPLNESNVSAWYKIVSYVPQNIALIDGTITENIAFGIDQELIDPELLHSVVDKAQLKKFVDDLPQGINSQIGDKGVKLSGGQRQRLGIARALYHKAEILIFDEATSSLDMETEQLITESINNISHQDLTIIVVAHRIQTLKYCDRIYRMENGSINKQALDYKELSHFA